MLLRETARERVLTGTGSSESGGGPQTGTNRIRAPNEAQRKRAVPETPTEPINLLLPQHFSPTAEQDQVSRVIDGWGPGVQGDRAQWAHGSLAVGSLPDGEWGPPVYSPTKPTN